MISYNEWKLLSEVLNGMNGENPPISTSAADPISASPGLASSASGAMKDIRQSGTYATKYTNTLLQVLQQIASVRPDFMRKLARYLFNLLRSPAIQKELEMSPEELQAIRRAVFSSSAMNQVATAGRQRYGNE